MSSLSPLYLAEVLLQRSRQRVFLETDRDTNSRAYVLGLMATGEIEAVKVLEIDEEAGTCRDVTCELQLEASAMMMEAA